jgi:DnaJ family protein C protein 8
MLQHTPLSNTSDSTAAPSEAPAYNSIKSIKDRMNVEDQIERLLSQVWRNPYDVLGLDKEATDEEIRKSFKAMSLLLHPDKCKDPRGPDCFTIIEQSYKTLLDPEKRKVFQKIMREAWERTEYDRQKENKRREKVGQCLIPEDTFDAEYRANTRRIFDEIEDKKAHYLRLEEGAKRRRQEETQLLILKEQFRILTEEEWEKSRDDRINKWRSFSSKKGRVGSKGTNGAIRAPAMKVEERSESSKQDTTTKPIWINEDYKKNWK